MPTRYLKPGICDSDQINKLEPLTETLYYRLLVNVDDFGRIDARPAVVRAKCFPLKEFTNETVGIMLNWLQDARLIVIYESNSKIYLQFCKWVNKARATVSKCPEYSGVTLTNLPVTVTETDIKPLSEISLVYPYYEKGKEQISISNTIIIPNRKKEFDIFWKAYPVKKGKKKAYAIWIRGSKIRPLDKILAALKWQMDSDQWKKGFIPYPSRYINEHLWDDENIVSMPDGIDRTPSPWWETWESTKEKAADLGIRTEGLSTKQVKIKIQEILNRNLTT